MSTDLKDKTLEELEGIVASLGQKKYLAGYLFKFIHAQDGEDLSAISALSKAFRAELAERGFFISRLKVVESLRDPDGSAKFLLELADGERIEAVLLPEDKRKTLCVSTQVGCAMGCGFCATARIRLRRSLTAAEIVDQVYAVEASLVAGRSSLDNAAGSSRVSRASCPRFEGGTAMSSGNLHGQDARATHGRAAHATLSGGITNIVYMGMGEPLENYDALFRSIRILNHPAGRNIGIRHITISTCGIAPGIRRLAQEDIHPRLAISLNAPSDTLRSELMPINHKYPLAELLEAVRDYQAKTGQRVTFEYVLIDKVNDSIVHARMLVKLLRGLMVNVNLIEHNPFAGFEYAASSRHRIQRFASALKEAGVETTIRFRMGRGIKAACGQLQAGYKARLSAKPPRSRD